MNVHLIAVTGGSGSGKTWLVQQLLREFVEDAGRISLDDFYHDLSHLPPEEREGTNFDHPDAIDWSLFQQCLGCIASGEVCELPSYDFATHTRRTDRVPWVPPRMILIDGLWLLHREELRALYSLSIFVECSEPLRFERRLARDQIERLRSERSVREQFDRYVVPMHLQFVAPQARHADLVIETPFQLERLNTIRTHCNRLLYPRTSP